MTHSSATIEGRRSFFRETSMGQPPTIIRNPLLPPSSFKKNDHSKQREQVKTVPFKELEKTITDLKKENFDLKLRLFHLENVQQENQQLSTDLKACQRELAAAAAATSAALWQTGWHPAARSTRTVGTQTVAPAQCRSTISPLSSPATYHTAFETSPEYFGLQTTNISYHRSVFDHDSEEDEDQNNNLDLVVDALSNLLLKSPVLSDDNVQDWLDEFGSSSSEPDSPVLRNTLMWRT